MNKLTHLVIGGLVGGGLGYVVGSIVADRLYPEYEEVDLNKLEGTEMDVSSYEAVAERLRNAKTKKPKKGDGIINYNKVEVAKNKRQLDEISKKYREDNGEISEEVGKLTPTEPIDPMSPIMIDPQAFDTIEEYKSHSLTYFDLDDVVADEANNVVQNPENLLGEEALTCFGQEGMEDPDVIYVRNPKFKCDYEVIRVRASYSARVLGMKTLPANVVKSRIFDEESEA